MATYDFVKDFFEGKGFDSGTGPQRDGKFKFYKVRPQCSPDHIRALYDPRNESVEIITRVSLKMSSDYIGTEIKENLTQVLEPVKHSLQNRVNELVQNDDVAINVKSPTGTTLDALFFGDVKTEGKDPQEAYTRLQHILKERFGYRI